MVQAVDGDGCGLHQGNRRQKTDRLLLLAADCVGKPLQPLKEPFTGCSTTAFVTHQKKDWTETVVDVPWVDVPQAITHSVQPEFLCDLSRRHGF